MKKVLAFLLAALMLLPLFVACGETKATEATEKASDKVSETVTDPARTIVVGYTIYEPMNYFDGEGNLVGFDTELAEKVFGALGYNVTFKEINWDNKYTELNAGTIDCVWNGFTANTADDDGVLRSERVDFSYNYMLNQQVVVTTKTLAESITGMADLAGLVGAAEKGSAGSTFIDGIDGAIKKDVTAQRDSFLELKAGTAQFAVVDRPLAKSTVGKGDYENLTIVESLSGESEYYAIGFKKGSELTALVNAQLEALAKDGTITALGEKYNVINTVITDFTDQK